MKPSPDYSTRLIERASSTAQVRLSEKERQQLMAALLARQHIILTGPADVGKLRFARALASSIAQDQKGEIRSIQGHPWWAENTGDMTRFVTMQTNFSLWRLIDFVEPILSAGLTSSIDRTESTDITDNGEHYLVACIERMSLLEIDMYYGDFLSWLSAATAGATPSSSALNYMQLIGTYDADEPPSDRQLRQLTAVIHLERPLISQPVAKVTPRRLSSSAA